MPQEKQNAAKDFIDGVGERLSEELRGLEAVLPGDDLKRILIAFSGGPDSTALLLALAQSAPAKGWQLHACHINHGLRGLESDLDQEFSEKLCADLSVPFTAYRLCEIAVDDADVSENRLRELRYQHLFDHARNKRINVLVTGHTLDDQAETMLFRLFRGTSPTGLLGMESKRELVHNSSIWLIRPLLNYTKSDCQRLLAIEQIAAHFDSSNENPHYARNFIRSQIVPKIDERFPGWKDRLERLRTVLAEQEDWIETETASQLAKIRKRDDRGEYLLMELFSSSHIASRRRMIAEMLRERAIEPSFEKIENVLSLPGSLDSALTLSPEWEVRIDENKLRWLQILEDDAPSAFLLQQETEVRLPNPGEQRSRSNIISWLDKSLKIEELSADEPFDRNLLDGTGSQIFADLSGIDTPLTVRLRRAGDTIQPFGMSEKVRLKQYLHTHKSSGIFKHTVVLCDSGGEVLWVPGAGISERLRFTSKPTHRLTFVDLASGDNSTWA